MNITDHFIPVFASNLESAVAHYEKITGKPSDRQWAIPDAELQLATVYPYVIVSGTEQALGLAKNLRSVVYVDSMTELKAILAAEGTPIVRDQHGPVGPSIFVEHPDGTFIEYVEPQGQ
ncbi:VOC family protein [Paenibacillus sp. 8b26]|uniref:VOC family protein n=1 Tax=Paenibacillus sp. 8b26 TaxID=3424133 RepID=UPI003D64EFFA